MGILQLQSRRVVPELMDAPNLEAGAHQQALAGLARINKVSRAATVMAGAILRMARREGIKQIRLLDVACGGGDVPVRVAGVLRRSGVTVELMLLDRSATALQQAAERARRLGIACKTAQGDVQAGLPDGEFDVVTNSLFLHHLTAPETVEALAMMKKLARRLVVVSDLSRSRMGWIAAWLGCHLLSRSAMVRHDGPASVAAAWTQSELAKFAKVAGMGEARIERCWPWRMLLTWETGRG